MQEFERIEREILARGEVDRDSLEALRRRLYEKGRITRPEADFLVALHKRVEHSNPSFDYIFYRAIQDHLLGNGWVDAEKVEWMRRVLFADGTMQEDEKKFLKELKCKAQKSSREFEAFFQESMQAPELTPLR